MPRYEYQCIACDYIGEEYRSVEYRDDWGGCPICKGGFKRRFSPTTNICVPNHFRLNADWCLPDASDTAAWDARQGSSQRHAPQQESFSDYFNRTVRDFD